MRKRKVRSMLRTDGRMRRYARRSVRGLDLQGDPAEGVYQSLIRFKQRWPRG